MQATTRIVNNSQLIDCLFTRSLFYINESLAVSTYMYCAINLT